MPRFVLCLFALCVSGSAVRAADPPKKEVPKPLPKDVVEAWEKAGAEVGWLEKRVLYKMVIQPTRTPAQPGWLPVIVLREWKEGMLKRVPAPEVPFVLLVGNATEAGLKEIAQLKHLVSLDLHGMELTPAGLKSITEMKQLVSLDLGATSVTDADLSDVTKLEKLTYLGLNLTDVSDAKLKELVKLKQLTTLCLFNTAVTNAGMKDLARIENLTTLDLRGTNVTDEGLKELVRLKKLTTLNLRGTKVTDAGVEELRKSLPGCEIEK